jgi:predicted RNase H-like nuclease
MEGEELRRRIDKIGITYRQAARQLKMSVGGLHQQMRGLRRVSRQTEALLEVLEERRMARTVFPVYPRPAISSQPRRIAAAPEATKTITGVDLTAHQVFNAIDDLRAFAVRYSRLSAKIDEKIRVLRLDLLDLLNGAETHQLDEIRRERKPKLKAVEE